MGKKMKLPFLFKTTEPPPFSSSSSSKSSWQYWPSCHQPKTLSFRANDDMFKTLNSSYFDVIIDTPESCFTNSSESCQSFSASSEDESGGDSIETVIRGLRSERLFFEPGETSSILEVAKEVGGLLPFKEIVVLSMESEDPYVDFKMSMEEMVEAHGLKDWECFEDLLCWYLKVNGKNNHRYIVAAFVDLLVGFSFASSSSPSSPLSFTSASSSTTLCSSSLQAELHIEEQQQQQQQQQQEDNGLSLAV